MTLCNVPCTPITCPSTTQACPDCGGNGWSMYNLINNPEHNLMKSHLCEITDVRGFPVEYRVLQSNFDYLFGEDAREVLSQPIPTKIIYNPEEETAILDIFGITGDNTLQYIYIPIEVFERDMTDTYLTWYGNVPVVPKVGDVITVTAFNRSYEITNVSKDQTIMLGMKFTYNIIARPFRFSEQSGEHREVHTGIIDGVPDPFEDIVTMPDGTTVVEKTYSTDSYGDNTTLESDSNVNYDYSREYVDPDFYAFQPKK